MGMFDRIRNAWNAFSSENNRTDNTDWAFQPNPGAITYGRPPTRVARSSYSEKSILSSIYTRISIDVAGFTIRHVKVDEKDRFNGEVPSKLNDCLKFEANLDQGPRHFRQNIVDSLFNDGVAVIVPVDTSRNPQQDTIFDIYSLRVGAVTAWYPKHVRVRVYNEATGLFEEITLEKRICAIIENPLFSVMNETNSTLQRLKRKLALLDQVDEQVSSGKLDIIIQLPYVVKSEARKAQAVQRREDLEFQLRGSQYGVAYTDATEKITQLNRPVETTLPKQVEGLTNLLYVELGLTPEVMNGTADEAAMRNYQNRTVEPIMDAIVEAMQRAFLGPRGTSQQERIRYFQDPFKLVPISQIADIADKFIRNQIAAPNEIRQAIGMMPSDDPKADELSNPNMPQADQADPATGPPPIGEDSQNGS